MKSPSDADLSAHAQEILHRASLTADLPAIDRRIVVLGLAEEAIDHEHLDFKDILEAAYGDREGSAYWSGWLAEDFSPLYQFIRFLEIHNGKKQDLFYISRSQVLEAFSVAARSNPSWLRYVVETGEQIVRTDLGAKSHPQLLANWEICRGPAVSWLFQHPEFSEMTPKHIAAHLRNLKSNIGAPERPDSKPSTARKRRTPQGDACEEAFSALYPNGLPDRKSVSDQKLVGAVEDFIRLHGLNAASRDTILRAAGRRRID
nr:hypothetical protein [Methylobacterium sp. Leaf122]